MPNHPNRSKFKTPAARPPPPTIHAARQSLAMSPRDAAQVVYATERAWRSWEAGERPMHPAIWELFKVKTLDRQVLNALGLTPSGHSSGPSVSGTLVSSAPAQGKESTN